MAQRRSHWKRPLAVLAAAVSAVLLAGCGATAEAVGTTFDQVDAAFGPDTVAALEQAATEAVESTGATAVVAGVWAPWAGIWTTALGTSGLDDGADAATEDVHFRIGELTTGFTCTVLLRLVDEGVVTVDEPVSELIPEIPGLGRITLGELCRATSGLADYRSLLGPIFIENPERQWSPRELVASGLSDGRSSTPREGWSSSYTAIALLGMALTRATGSDWPELYQDYVFAPLGLAQTSLPADRKTEPTSPYLHSYQSKIAADGSVQCDVVIDETLQSSSAGWVAGGIESTLSDLHRWSQVFATGALLTDESAKRQWDTARLGPQAPSWQSYGFGGAQFGPMRGGASASPGSLTAAFTDPESGLSVVVHLNDSTSGAALVRELAFRLASIASTADAASGASAPLVPLPWSTHQVADKMRAAARCAPASE